MTTMSVAEAKARFAECVRMAEQGEAVVITRHGKPVAAVVGADEIELYERLRAAGPQSGLVSLAGGWEGTEELVAHLAGRARTTGRKVRNTGSTR